MEVTAAILRAEKALKDAIREYERVEALERELSEHPRASDLEKKLASDGVAIASRRLRTLRRAW